MINKSRFVLILVGLHFLLFDVPSEAAVVVNEVLANEPGGTRTLEWIEIYNNSFTEVSMAGFKLRVTNLKTGEKWIEFPDNLQLVATEHYLICRKLFSSDTSGFEDVWGNGSGAWGDTPEESGLQEPFVTSFSLTNDSGSVELYNTQGLLISEFAWYTPGKDAFSWERVSPQSDVIEQSIDPSGSTPGFVNSHTPIGYDLALERVEVTPDDGGTILTFTVTNRGLSVITNAFLFLYVDTSAQKGSFADTIDVIGIDEAAPDSSIAITRRYFFEGVYIGLSASLTDDDRNRNNRLDFVATGVDFPPIILSELLTNPKALLTTEWVEIKNRLNEPFDIVGWQLGDSLRLYTITGLTLTVDADEYFVLVDDSQAFLNFYPGFNENYLQPARWPQFNIGSDVVRLVDSFGIEADRFEYTRTFDSNFTWSRGEDIGRENDWGRSENVAGSPGERNAVLYEMTGSHVTVTIEPNVFSPDGDGFEDMAVISVEAPKDKELTMRIYDRQGRIVKTVLDGERYIKDSYEWDGRSDSGNRLPIGIYILYFEAAGSESVKKPIVIAR